MPLTAEQIRNIQGVGLAGFRKDHQRLVFVTFRDASTGRALLSALAPLVASFLEVSAFNRAYGEILRRTERDDVICATWVGLLLGPRGYEKLGVSLASELPAGPGSEAFAQGMAARAADIGHTRQGDQPGEWLAAFRPENRVDACVVLAADDPEDLDRVCAEVDDLIAGSGAEIAFEERSEVLPGALKGHEHFGFKDGISQPAIEGLDPDPAQNEPPPVPLGEFVLGYPDAAETDLNARSLWRDGSFVAFERILQHVLAFRLQAAKAAEATGATFTPPQMAAKMVGRWPSGAPLQTAPESEPADGAGVTNAFQYKAEPFGDDEGVKTPRFAHVRKANPRDETRPDPETLVARRRMIRRGVPFGPPLPAEASEDDGRPRGLHFLCFVSDLDRQFEFIRREWLSNPNFPNGGKPETPSGPYQPPTDGTPADGPDPVVGEHDPGAQCALHTAAEPHTFPLEAEVVNVTAGEYFFAPSLSAIAALAAGQTTSQSGA